ncbi:MAG TPA: transglutaminase domain-containing protein, partial [Polyangiaceae bacterium]|nr:transglutaminase domain-containing protein [Polyangiaceae bacterium]
MNRLPRFTTSLCLLVAAAQAYADGPVLHEFIAQDPREDLELQATTPDGKMAAALDTPSGVVPAPSEHKTQPQVAYGGNATPDSIDATYRIDRDTTRPEAVGYDDPFVPAVTPFKRLYAYDAVDESMELVVSDKKLRRVYVGVEPLQNEDQFFADLFVDVAAGPVRIPSVGPGARVVAARAEPPMNFELVRDGADNWFVVGDGRKRVRLVMQLSIPRAVFGSPFADVSWGTLARHVPLLPPAARSAARDVLSELGISDAVRPRDAVAALVAHFRSFAPSDDAPKSQTGPALYQELALSKKGVCRHRAYAFVITALAAGVPARMVRNEAHAWVEIFDGAIWHRVDLGGAAGRFELDPTSRTQPHVPPDDPFSWPPGTESTLDSIGAPSGPAQPSPAASGRGAGQSPLLPGPAASDQAAAAPPGRSNDDGRPSAQVVLEVGAAEARRGAVVHVKGNVTADGDPCAFSRVDIVLRSKNGDGTLLGAVPTDDRGRYDATLTIPLYLEVGDYSVSAS